ncbi:MAG: prepilin-type N-terminal cleavage/methylation domain-containing protein [Deltaproteobacteria bacterium]|nr:prepilin-type N-terminal cleavage/methylation domain-containing protein [Deltaproteobacteria bacterium]
MTRTQRGFTLVELMVVVAIVSVLATAAGLYLRPVTRPIDVAVRVGDLMREANQRAIALGPVRGDVAVAIGTRARTRVRAIGAAPQPTFVVERLEEAPEPASTATWFEIGRYTVDSAVVADSFSNGVAAHGALPVSTAWTSFSASCYPDGRCDARTLYFRLATSASDAETFARMSVLPLGGAIMTRKDWN